MEYKDYHDGGHMFRKVADSFEIELSNGWVVLGDGGMNCDYDEADSAGADCFVCENAWLSDSDGNEIPQEKLKDELFDEFSRKFEDYFRSLLKQPYKNLFSRIC